VAGLAIFFSGLADFMMHQCRRRGCAVAVRHLSSAADGVFLQAINILII
jgi:hypothetical protein